MNPTTLLEKGTPVRVINKRGVVVSSKLVHAHNGGMVAVTRVMFQEWFQRGFGQNGQWKKLATAEFREVGYTAITVL